MKLKPDNVNPILASAYYAKGPPVFTPHVFVEMRRCELAFNDGSAYELIFRCLVHGTERRWGTIDPDPSKWGIAVKTVN